MRRKWIFAALLLYSAAHMGYSVFQYNPLVLPRTHAARTECPDAADWKLPEKSPVGGIAVYYPPLYYLMIAPLKVLSWDSVIALSYLSQFVLAFLAIFCLVRAVSPRASPSLVEYGLAAVITANFHPLLTNFALHSVEAKEMSLMCFAIYAFRLKKDFLAGGLILLAAGLKYLPLFFLFYFIAKREYRALWGAVLAAVLGFLALIPMLGWKSWSYAVEYPFYLLLSSKAETNGVVANVEWQTLSGSILRLFGVPGPGDTFSHQLMVGISGDVSHPALALRIALVLKGLFVAGYIFLIRKRWSSSQREEKWPLYLLEISLTLLMIFMVIQAGRIHYLVLLLPAFVMVGLLLYSNKGLFPLREKILFITAYGLGGIIIPVGLFEKFPRPAVLGEASYYMYYLWFSFPFLGYLLLGWSILRLHRRFSQIASPAVSRRS